MTHQELQEFKYIHSQWIWREHIIKGHTYERICDELARTYVKTIVDSEVIRTPAYNPETLEIFKEIAAELREIYDSTCVVITTTTLDMRKLEETIATLKFRMQLAFEQYCKDRNINLR